MALHYEPTHIPPASFSTGFAHNPCSQTFAKALGFPGLAYAVPLASVPILLPGAERSLPELHPWTGRGRWTSCAMLPTGCGKMQIPGPCPLQSGFSRSGGSTAWLETHSFRSLHTLHSHGDTEAQRADTRGSRRYSKVPRLSSSQS